MFTSAGLSRFPLDLDASSGQFEPNRFGTHDVQGNVWEYVADCYRGSYVGAPTDGSPWMFDLAPEEIEEVGACPMGFVARGGAGSIQRLTSQFQPGKLFPQRCILSSMASGLFILHWSTSQFF